MDYRNPIHNCNPVSDPNINITTSATNLNRNEFVQISNPHLSQPPNANYTTTTATAMNPIQSQYSHLQLQTSTMPRVSPIEIPSLNCQRLQLLALNYAGMQRWLSQMCAEMKYGGTPLTLPRLLSDDIAAKEFIDWMTQSFPNVATHIQQFNSQLRIPPPPLIASQQSQASPQMPSQPQQSLMRSSAIAPFNTQPIGNALPLNNAEQTHPTVYAFPNMRLSNPIPMRIPSPPSLVSQSALPPTTQHSTAAKPLSTAVTLPSQSQQWGAISHPTLNHQTTAAVKNESRLLSSVLTVQPPPIIEPMLSVSNPIPNQYLNAYLPPYAANPVVATPIKTDVISAAAAAVTAAVMPFRQSPDYPPHSPETLDAPIWQQSSMDVDSSVSNSNTADNATTATANDSTAAVATTTVTISAEAIRIDTSQNNDSNDINQRKTRPRRKRRKQYDCDACDRVYPSWQSLKEHLNTAHRGLKPFKCEYCNQRFGFQSNLIIHRRWHTGERPYPCDLCPKAFVQKSDLTNHRRVHTGEKPFKCDQCDRAFAQNCNLRYHKLLHKRDENMNKK